MDQLENLVKKRKIEERHRDTALRIVRNFYELNHGKIDPFQDTDVFYKGLASFYKSIRGKNTKDKRDLAVNGIEKIVAMSKRSYTAKIGLGVCENLIFGIKDIEKKIDIKPIPQDAYSLWINSFTHLSTSNEEYDLDQRIGRYIRLSKDHLLPYTPSYLPILRRFGEGENLYGIEDYVFSLARNEKPEDSKVLEYFDTLKKIPLELREKIEYVRRNVNQDNKGKLDRDLYELLSIPDHRIHSYKDVVTLLEEIVKHSNKNATAPLLNNIPILTKLGRKNIQILRMTAKRSVDIVLIEGFYKEPVLNSYLETVDKVTDLGIDPKNDSLYAFVPREIFKDYYTGRIRASNKEIQGKCIDSVRKILESKNPREALQLVGSAAGKIKRSFRVERTDPLYLDDITDIVKRSIEINREKAVSFIKDVISYSDLIHKGVQNDG